MLGWARAMTNQVCATGDPQPPCNFDAAVKLLYEKGGLGGKSKSVELQCAFTLQGWSVDPDPDRDQVFGHPARRIGNSGTLGKVEMWNVGTGRATYRR